MNMYINMSRLCRGCNINKSTESFPSVNHHICRDCQNIKKREQRKSKKIVDHELLSKFQVLTLLVNELKKDDVDIRKIRAGAMEYVNEIDRFMEKEYCLAFPYELDPVIFKFLRLCVIEKGIRICDIRNVVYDKSSNDEFPYIYGVTREIMVSHMKDIGQLIDTIASVKEMYNELIDEANCRPHKSPNWKEIPPIDVIYNFPTNCIKITENPLDLDANAFFTRVKSYENHISFKGVIEMGKFEKFYQTYDVI
jgi:hypothetical protein